MVLPLITSRVGPRMIYNLASRGISTTAPTSGAYWNKDWRPADEPPTTEDGKRAAAKKYGMIPEDYETYPNDGTGYGDYPKLPLISGDARDPHALYDFPEHKRNFGEPMHVHFDMVTEDKWDYNRRFYIPLHIQAIAFLGTVLGGAVLFWMGEYVKYIPVPMMPKPKPFYDGKTYYSFDFEECD